MRVGNGLQVMSACAGRSLGQIADRSGSRSEGVWAFERPMNEIGLGCICVCALSCGVGLKEATCQCVIFYFGGIIVIFVILSQKIKRK